MRHSGQSLKSKAALQGRALVPYLGAFLKSKAALQGRAMTPLAILAVALAGSLFLVATKPAVAPIPIQELKWPVRVTIGQRIDIKPSIRAYGEIVARHSLGLRPRVAGTVERIGDNVRNGGVVSAGEALVVIDAFEYRAAVDEAKAKLSEAKSRKSELQAQLGAAKTSLLTDREQLALRQRELDRNTRLVENGTISRATLDKAVSALNVEQQRVLAAERDIEVLDAKIAQQNAAIEVLHVRLRLAERDALNTTLKAPFDGFVTDVNLATGKQISTTDVIARIVDANSLEVRFHLSDGQYARLIGFEGIEEHDIEVLWRVGGADRKFDAEIVRSEGQIDPASGGIAVYASIRDVGVDTLLRPGAFVELIIPDRIYEKVFELQRLVVHDGSLVYVVGSDGRIEPRTVKILLRTGDTILVDGDLDGEKIVATDFPEIGPGLLVEIIE